LACCVYTYRCRGSWGRSRHPPCAVDSHSVLHERRVLRPDRGIVDRSKATQALVALLIAMGLCSRAAARVIYDKVERGSACLAPRVHYWGAFCSPLGQR